MSIIESRFYADALGMETCVQVLLPEAHWGAPRPYPVLYLLHGLGDDSTAWMRKSSLERYWVGRPFAVVMPHVGNSFYNNVPNGANAWDYISRELPQRMQHDFPLSARREDTCVAGLSMGGYGAFRLALSMPERFAGAVSLSGALDMLTSRYKTKEFPSAMVAFEQAFGTEEAYRSAGCDLFTLLTEAKRPLPELLAFCGWEDFLWEENQAFCKAARRAEVPLAFEAGPGGHSWHYWDEALPKTLDFVQQVFQKGALQ